MIIDLMIFCAGVYLIFIGTLMNTEDAKSMILFNVLPIALGVADIAAFVIRAGLISNT